jgi:hypothetical protein
MALLPLVGNLEDVIPAKAGTHFDLQQEERWIPAFAGMTSRKDLASSA